MLTFHVLSAAGAYVGPLHSAKRMAYLAELSGAGGGSFEINPYATDFSRVEPARIIEVRWLGTPIGQFTVDTIEDPIVALTKDAMVKVSGQGLLGLLRKAVLYPHAWPALTDPDATDAPLVCAPSFGVGFFGLLSSNVDLPFTFSFKAGVDSENATWPEDVYLEFRAGQNMLDVVNALVGRGYDIRFSAYYRTMDAYISAGDDVTGNIILQQGKHIRAMTRKRESGDLATVVLGAGQTNLVETADFSWTTDRRQAYLQVRNAIDEQQVLAANTVFLERYRQPVDSYDLEVVNSPMPLYDYYLGDIITVITARGGTQELRVLSVQIQQETDSPSALKVTLGVNQVPMTFATRINAAMGAQVPLGAAGGWKLLAPETRPLRPGVVFDWKVSGTVSSGNQQGGVYEVRDRLQVLDLSGGVGTAPGSTATINVQYSQDDMATWEELYSIKPTVGASKTRVTDGVYATTLLLPGMFLRFNVDTAGSSAMANLSVRLRCQEV